MKYIVLMLLLCILISIIGCDSNDEFPYPVPEKTLVGECVFQQDQVFNVKVFLPKALNDTNAYEYRSDCKVEIQAPGISTDVLHYNAATKSYLSSQSYIAQPGKFYRLKVEDPVYGLITAEDIFPQATPVTISPIQSIKEMDSSQKGILYHYDINLDVPLADGLTPLFYNILLTNRIKHPDGKITERRSEIVSFKESVFNVDLMYHKGGVLIEGEPNSKTHLNLTLTCSALETPVQDSLVEVRLDIRSTSENYYLFYKSVNNQIKQISNPFESPSPLYTNFKNGIGIFAGYSSKKQTLTIPEH